MSTGDLKGNLRKIEQGLRLLNYPKDVDYTGLANGDPSAFLPIISYCFISFSTFVTELLVESNVELTAKNDFRFIEAIYKLLRDHFQYKPILTKQQFLQYGFAERKIQIVCDIIGSVYKKHKELSNINKVKSQKGKTIHSVRPQPQANFPNHLDSGTFSATVFQQVPIVEHHPNQLVCIPEKVIDVVLRDHDDEVASSFDVLNNVPEQVLEDNNHMEELKSQLSELQEKFNTLNLVEDRLQILEEKLQGKVIIDEKDWKNLVSRVLLLETQLLLQSGKVELSVEPMNDEENTSSRNLIPVSPDREKELLPETLPPSSGYSSPLSVAPSHKAVVVDHPGLSKILKDMNFEEVISPAFQCQETTKQRMERLSKMIEETSELLKASSHTS